MLRFSFISLLLCQCLLAGGDAVAAGWEKGSAARPLAVAHAGEADRAYSTSSPLRYEDSWERWPYAFLDNDGVPRGFSIDLIKRMMRRLHIPYEVKLRSLESLFEDLKNNECDVTLGVMSDYNASFGYLGKVTVSYHENSVLMPKKGNSLTKISIEQLRGRQLVFRTNSIVRTHLLEKGFPDSLFTVMSNMDMETEILREASLGIGGAVWNRRVMERVIRKYHLSDHYMAVPIDMPLGEYRFMSRDSVLLARLDSLCTLMHENGEIKRLLEKWRYMETLESANNTNDYVGLLMLMFVVTVLAIIAFFVILSIRRLYSRKQLNDIRTQMKLALRGCKIKVWIFFPDLHCYAWMTSDGEIRKFYRSYDFSKFYPDHNFNRIHSYVVGALTEKRDPLTETMRCYSVTEPSKVLDVEVTIHQLFDEYGKVYLICGLQCDITDSKAAQARMRLLGDRYRTAFCMARGTVMRFDAAGRIIGFNEQGLIRMGIKEPEKFYAEGYTIRDVDLLKDIDLDTCPNDLRFTRIVKRENILNIKYAGSKYFNPEPYAMHGYTGPEEMGRTDNDVTDEGYYDLHFVKSVDENGVPFNYMLFINDKTIEVKAIKQLREKRRRMEAMEQTKQLLRRRRDYVLHVTDIRMISYHPGTKELSIYNHNLHTSRTYSQISLLEFIDSDDIKKVVKVLMQLDNLYRGHVTLEIKTLLYNEKGELRHFHLDVKPDYGVGGNVVSYFGICRDITDAVYARKRLLEEIQIVRDVELVKSGFLKNTSYSLRRPLISISRSIQSLGGSVTDEQQTELVGSITSNIRRLLKLSDDTLLLSRIEAGLLTLKREPVDFVQLFQNTIRETLEQYPSSTVTHTVENTYESLWLNFDRTCFARILHEAVALSARYTSIGNITVRYMYIKGKLSIIVQDTGQGIPPNVFNHIFDAHLGDEYTMQERAMHLSGLEMSICKAIIDMVGGNIEIDTDPGRGTSIYITLNMEQVEGTDTADEPQPSEPDVKDDIQITSIV